jgi:purine-nucleoside phosphorylase
MAPGTGVEPRVELAARALREQLRGAPRAAIVAGSGLGDLARGLDSPVRVPYAQIPGFPAASVVGHAGELVAGTLAGIPTVVQSGRFHLYEGHDPDTVALPVRTFAALGAEILIITNAAGGLEPRWTVPTLMLIADHLNLMWRNPLIGRVLHGEERFPDLSAPYDPDLRLLARESARDLGVRLEEGVYAGVLGPSYETPAEIAMLRRAGASAVGMSTVPEVIAARARGLRVLGVSTITNFGAGITGGRLTHDEVLAAGRVMAADLVRLVQGVLARVGPARNPLS